jgi:Fe-S-cluster containining protein
VAEVLLSLKHTIAMAKYLELVRDVDQAVVVVRSRPDQPSCPATCCDCCQAAAALPVGVAEMEHVLDALDALPADVREYVLERAEASVRAFLDCDLDVKAVTDAPLRASDALHGRPEAACPALVGGVCAVYAHRPIICRVWGLPISNGKGVDCCPKTRPTGAPGDGVIPYVEYWRKARTVSASLGQEAKEPMAHLMLRRWQERQTERRSGEPGRTPSGPT